MIKIINTWSKYIRYMLGIPTFCLGIAGIIYIVELLALCSGFWEELLTVIGILSCIYWGLVFLDVPSITTINLNSK